MHWKGLLCPGHADKYGNSIFIGCINISVCTYISYIIVQGPKGGPTGQPQQHNSYPPFPRALSALCKPRPTAPAPASSQEKSLYREGVRGQGARRQEVLVGGRHATKNQTLKQNGQLAQAASREEGGRSPATRGDPREGTGVRPSLPQERHAQPASQGTRHKGATGRRRMARGRREQRTRSLPPSPPPAAPLSHH